LHQSHILIQASDSGSGVFLAYDKVDQGPQEYTLTLSVSNRYSAVWDIRPNQDGAHRIDAYAQDFRNNISQPVGVNIDADANSPAITTDAPAEGAVFNHPISITYSAADARLNTLGATLNGQPFASGGSVS